jgi:hypothetical protein
MSLARYTDVRDGWRVHAHTANTDQSTIKRRNSRMRIQPAKAKSEIV